MGPAHERSRTVHLSGARTPEGPRNTPFGVLQFRSSTPMMVTPAVDPEVSVALLKVGVMWA